jgi:hypothetical protein
MNQPRGKNVTWREAGEKRTRKNDKNMEDDDGLCVT